MVRAPTAAGRSAERRFEVERRHRTVRCREVAAWLGLAAVLVAEAVRGAADHADAALVGAAVLVVVAVLRRPRPDAERWLRGAAGEVATAQLLDGLGRRWELLHDRRLPGSVANVDHLVVGRRGVWVVDSKAFRAPLRPGWRSVRVGNRLLDTSGPAWLAEQVGDLAGIEVRPLVVVHGRGLAARGRRCDGVRVVPADGALARLRRERFGPRRGRAARRELADLLAAVLPEA